MTADESFLPYRNLALRVLARALRDAGRCARSAERDDARAFLASSPMLHYWCRVASLDPSQIINQARLRSGVPRD